MKKDHYVPLKNYPTGTSKNVHPRSRNIAEKVVRLPSTRISCWLKVSKNQGTGVVGCPSCHGTFHHQPGP